MSELKEWQSKAIGLKNLGKSNRAIAREIWGDTDKEYKLRRLWKKEHVTPLLNRVDIKKPVITFIDIETLPHISFHYPVWKTNLSDSCRLRDSALLSFAYKFLGDEDVKYEGLTPQQCVDYDDFDLVLKAWSVLDNSDVIVAHNGVRFDAKELNKYFIKYGLIPPSPYKVIDTLQMAKSKFRMTFNSLSHLARYLGVTHKLDSGGNENIKKILQGDAQALEKNREYNIGDIVTLEEVYEKLRTWDNGGVNLAVMQDENLVGMLCSHCGSDDIIPLDSKFIYTPQQKYSAFRCNSCKAVLRSNTKVGKVNKLVRVI